MRLKHASHMFPVALSLLFVGISTSGAYAYLDGGTGSMILQVLLGGVAGLAVVGKLYWHKLLVLLRIRRNPSPAETKEKTLLDGIRIDK
ncbi:hypothetical protein [Nitratireductor sp. ZSWI3]|uniref:hypothetical protein n=1 Tax=Nitratireductor sp. ZSWI3 TaxID=2966359 RepID=UPI00214FD0A6|nr:hypothetical protein [Nitratireductor sp. ZSWI3]MCR4264709.1 hypothetical protein [Nitratireductor sp. ZSWI3]